MVRSVSYTEIVSQVVDKARARIGIAEEDLAPMDMESHQILNDACDSSFRSLIAQHVSKSVQDYRRWVETSVSVAFL